MSTDTSPKTESKDPGDVPGPADLGSPDDHSGGSGIRSLKDLLERASGLRPHAAEAEDSGLAEALPFPFPALVGQQEMKLALLLGLINPAIGGVLLVGPRGAGKTTAVRSLVDLLPQTMRSLCYYGCLPEDIETGGMDAVCPDCARKYGQGEPLAKPDRVRMVELPLNARLEDVVGGLDERAAANQRMRLRRGLLAQADRNLLYIDEVNLLSAEIVDAILDAAAQGHFTVRRGPISATYRSRFVLIGSMNPEEGRLRPQILDRFGLRVLVHGLIDPEERLEAYRRVSAYLENPRRLNQAYLPLVEEMRAEVQAARAMLPEVKLPEAVARRGLALIGRLQIDSLRAEITLFEAARAHAAADGRTQVEIDDLRAVALPALRGRRSSFMVEFLESQRIETEEIKSVIDDEIVEF